MEVFVVGPRIDIYGQPIPVERGVQIHVSAWFHQCRRDGTDCPFWRRWFDIIRRRN